LNQVHCELIGSFDIPLEATPYKGDSVRYDMSCPCCHDNLEPEKFKFPEANKRFYVYWECKKCNTAFDTTLTLQSDTFDAYPPDPTADRIVNRVVDRLARLLQGRGDVK
jgi:hypothetical protein